MIIQVIGVSGCGKSTIAKMLSEELGLPYFDADDFHPKENIDKMKSGTPLNDNDRAFWLKILSDNLKNWEAQGGAVLACSALKETYRVALMEGLKDNHWVYLSGPYDLIFERMHIRKDHYMGEAMLRSQFDALEVPEYGIHIDITMSPREIVKKVIASL